MKYWMNGWGIKIKQRRKQTNYWFIFVLLSVLLSHDESKYVCMCVCMYVVFINFLRKIENINEILIYQSF